MENQRPVVLTWALAFWLSLAAGLGAQDRLVGPNYLISTIPDGCNIFGQVVKADGGLPGENFRISMGFEVQAHPSVTYNPIESQFLVVWADNRNRNSTDLDIYGQVVE